MNKTSTIASTDRLCRDLVDIAGDYIFACAGDGEITLMNEAARRALGYEAEVIDRLRLADIVAPEHVDRLSTPSAAPAAGPMDLALVGINGRRIQTEASFRFAGNGASPAGVNVIARDVAGRQTAGRTSEDAAGLLGNLLENCPDLIYFKDLESRLVAHSKSFRDLLNLPDDADLIGKTDFDLYKPDHANAAFQDEQTIIRTGVSVIGKPEKETHPDGTVTWALTSKMPWRDDRGRVIGTFGISKNITGLKKAEARLEALNKRLVKTSRMAGMAEVANDVLHNVGNVLTSVNVACTMAVDRVRESRLSGLARLADLLAEHRDDLGAFITNDPAGQQIPEYVATLRDRAAEDRQFLETELEQLREKINHVKHIVAMQQNYARVAGAVETVAVVQTIEDALQINAAGLHRHAITVRKEFEDVPDLVTDKHKVLQILVNLISNAKYAMDECEPARRTMTIRTARHGPDQVRIEVEDQGAGIAPENVTRIFSHGFTTRTHGHGFGLHSGALTARELGGSLTAKSDGPGQGAVFTVLLPIAIPSGET